MFDSVEFAEIPALEKGDTHQLQVLGKKSGEDDVDITLNCLFRMSDRFSASIDSKGLLTALNGGGVTVTAKYGSQEATADVAISVPIDPEAPPVAQPDLIILRLNYFEVAMCFLGELSENEKIFQFAVAHPFTIKKDFAGARGVCDTPGDADNTIIGIKKNGNQIGAATFAPGETAAQFTVTDPVSFVPGDVLTMHVNAVDAAFRSPSITLYGEPDTNGA